MEVNPLNLDRIILSSQKNIRRAGTRDALKMAREIGIEVRFKDLGDCMGIYSTIHMIRTLRKTRFYKI